MVFIGQHSSLTILIGDTSDKMSLNLPSILVAVCKLVRPPPHIHKDKANVLDVAPDLAGLICWKNLSVLLHLEVGQGGHQDGRLGCRQFNNANHPPTTWAQQLHPFLQKREMGLTNYPTLLILDWCDPGLWRNLLKTCWCCYCCWCWIWGTCWQQFGRDFDAEDCSRYRGWGLVEILKLKHSWDFEVEVWSRFWNFGLVQVIKSRLGQDYEARFDRDFKVEVQSRFSSWSLVKILMLMFRWDFEVDAWSRF